VIHLAAAVSIGVFTLFHPDRLTVKTDQGTVTELRLAGSAIECFTKGELTTVNRVRIPARDGITLSVPGKIHRHFQGDLDVVASGGMLVPIINMDGELAVAAAVAAEMPPGTPREALKAQAIVARSYYAASRIRHRLYDFCDTTHCQFHREPPEENNPAAIATRETAGLVLTYQEQVFAPLYSASCGGRTKTAAQVGLQPDPYAYYSVECSTCRRGAPRWERQVDFATGAALLAGPSEQLRISLMRKLGLHALPGNNFTAERHDNTIVIRGRGEGHGVGLCQRGASAMALEGADYLKVLDTYYPATRVRPSVKRN
jgi:stage II sporulation protein D